MIAGVAIGGQPNSGYTVVISGASVSAGAITIGATMSTPGPSCVALPAITSPVDLARIPAMPGALQRDARDERLLRRTAHILPRGSRWIAAENAPFCGTFLANS